MATLADAVPVRRGNARDHLGGAADGLVGPGPGSSGRHPGHRVSIAGSQTASSYGEHVAAEFGFGLATAGTTVVAVTYNGIEVAAHRGALPADGTTLAVLACGIDLTYPANHRTLIDRIAGQGS